MIDRGGRHSLRTRTEAKQPEHANQYRLLMKLRQEPVFLSMVHYHTISEPSESRNPPHFVFASHSQGDHRSQSKEGDRGLKEVIRIYKLGGNSS